MILRGWPSARGNIVSGEDATGKGRGKLHCGKNQAHGIPRRRARKTVR
jgi:hypothetical protein